MIKDSILGDVRETRTPGGRVRFDVDIALEGRRHRRRFLRRREAELYLRKAQVMLAEGQFLPLQDEPSLYQLAHEFLADSAARKSKKTFRDVDSARLFRFFKFLCLMKHELELEVSRDRFTELVLQGNNLIEVNLGEERTLRILERTKLTAITSDLLEEYQRSLLLEVREVSAKDYMTTLKVALNIAVRKRWMPENPADRLPRITVPKTKPKFLLRHEVGTLLRSAREHPLFGLLAAGIFAGLRHGELTHLEWSDVDFDNNVIRVRIKPEWAPKWQRERDVPMEPLLREALLPSRRQGGLCFPAQGGGLRKNNLLRRLKARQKAAGIENPVSVHGLRHTYGSHMAMAGVPLTDISAWMGHTTLATTLLYAHLAPGRNRFKRDSVFEVESLEKLLATPQQSTALTLEPPQRQEAN